MADRNAPDHQPIDLSSLEGLTLGTAWSESPATPHTDRPERGPRPERRDDNRGSYAPRGPGGNNRFGGQRPSGPGPMGARAPQKGGDNRPRWDSRNRPAPIVPPSVNVVFYPEEGPFKALTKAIKASKRTYELFEIARLIVAKPECTVATVSHKGNSAPKVETAEGAPASNNNKGPALYQCVADGALFLTEAEAVAHASSKSLDKFYKMEEVEVEAPKGNFVVIHKCGITGELIAPPNYHRYAQLLAAHQAKHLPHMELAAIQAKLETVKEAEVIAQWSERMKKITRYSLLTPVEGQPNSFDSTEAATNHLATYYRAQLVKATPQARLTAKQIADLPSGEIKRSIEVARTMQTKFPLDTANNLRGRLRRIGLHIYKRGQKGVSYISAVKRKFRAVGQTFAPEVQRVIEFIEKNPKITDSELPRQLLGITPPVPVTAPAATVEGAPEAPAAAPVATLTPEESTALQNLKQTLHWLIEGGYVTHYGNGVLYVPPARTANAPKEEEDETVAEVATEGSPEASTEGSSQTSETAIPEDPESEEKPKA